MNSIMLGLLAETSLHPGSDTTGGVVDLPVAREATTSYPVIMGSGLKGALRELFEEKRSKDQAQEIFGKAEAAGNISITDGRLLLLPVRSLSGSHRWVTCPYILHI
jgi:CRISPR-associated protein Cmr4